MLQAIMEGLILTAGYSMVPSTPVSADQSWVSLQVMATFWWTRQGLQSPVYPALTRCPHLALSRSLSSSTAAKNSFVLSTQLTHHPSLTKALTEFPMKEEDMLRAQLFHVSSSLTGIACLET